MPITIKINKLGPDQEPIQETISLNARKSLDGNIMIFDHREIDIVVIPKTQKVLALAKTNFSDQVYEAQERLFSFLRKHGIVELANVQGGNVYGSLEAKLAKPINEEISAVESALYNISKYLKEEEEFYMMYEYDEEEEVEQLTDPSSEDSTELGEVPHEERKGSLIPGYIRGPYGMTSFYRY
tara:strand:- start:164 stop:712 length:549 start_codon:yes stop_codon:yes gene_type:complete